MPTCWFHEDNNAHEATVQERQQHGDELCARHRSCSTGCGYCYPDHPSSACECDDCYESYAEPDYEEEDDMPGWDDGPFEGEDTEGEFIKTTRTVGCEFEMETYNAAAGTNERIRSFGSGIGSDHCGVEVRTPPVKGAAADRILAGTLQAMLDGGHRPGSSAGLHVHVHVPEAMQRTSYGPEGSFYSRTQWGHDGTTYTADNSEAATKFSRLYALWYAVEHVTYRFDPNRRTNSFSSQVYRSRTERIAAVNEALAAATEGRVPNVAYGRYNSMNCNGGYGTVEFRNHGSTSDVPHVMAWVAFLQGVVDLSQKLSFIAIRRLAEAKTHDERARLLMQYGKRHGVWTPTAYAAIRKELGLSAARTRTVAPARRAA
jgi:hypothetical protein